MLSWEIVEHGKPLQRAIKDTPKPQGTEVLMRITRSLWCMCTKASNPPSSIASPPISVFPGSTLCRSRISWA